MNRLINKPCNKNLDLLNTICYDCRIERLGNLLIKQKELCNTGYYIGNKMISECHTIKENIKVLGKPIHFATFTSRSNRHRDLSRYVQDIRKCLYEVARRKHIHMSVETFVGEQLKRKNNYGVSCPDIHALISYEYVLDADQAKKIARHIKDMWWCLFGCSMAEVERFNNNLNWLDYCFKHDKHYSTFTICSRRPACRRKGCYFPSLFEDL